MLSSLRPVLHLRAGLLDTLQLLVVPSSQIQRLGLGNLRGVRTGMRRRRITDGEEIEGGEEGEEVGEDLDAETVVIVEEEETEEVIEATEEVTEAGMIESTMTEGKTGEMIGNTMTGEIGHVEDTEDVARMEAEVEEVTEAVEVLREEEEAQEEEGRMGTVIRQHIIKTSALNHSRAKTLGFRTMLIL